MHIISSVIICPEDQCSYAVSCTTELNNHLTVVHCDTIENGTFICKHRGCHSVLRNFNAFKKHLLRYHRHKTCQKPFHYGRCQEFLEISYDESDDESLDHIISEAELNENSALEYASTSTDPQSVEENFSQYQQVPSSNVELVSQAPSYETVLNQIHDFYLEFYAKKLVPAQTVGAELQRISSIFASVHKSMIPLLPNEVRRGIMEEHSYLMCGSSFETMSKIVINQFWKLCRLKGLIEPIKVELDNKHCFHYVSVVETLTASLSDSRFFSHFEENANQVFDGSYRNVLFSPFHTNHPFFQGDGRKIFINLYIDDIEVVNPLGSAAGKFTPKQGRYQE